MDEKLYNDGITLEQALNWFRDTSNDPENPTPHPEFVPGHNIAACFRNNLLIIWQQAHDPEAPPINEFYFFKVLGNGPIHKRYRLIPTTAKVKTIYKQFMPVIDYYLVSNGS